MSTASKLFVSELFTSVQGEGQLTGVPSVFIRLSGCNLRCSWCDTPYASWNPEGTHHTVDDVVNQVVHTGVRHVVLTGGEPMMHKGAVPLTHRLADAGFHITVETAGTVLAPLHIDLASISPKLADSDPTAPPTWATRHAERRHRPEVVARLIEGSDHQLKFVVGHDSDIAAIDAFVADVTTHLEHANLRPDSVQLMPRGRDIATIDANLMRILPLAMERGWRVTDRLHVRLFGDARGT